MSRPDGAPPVSILDYLRRATTFLGDRGSDSARLDAEVLLAHLLERPRIALYTAFDEPLERRHVDAFRDLLVRRGQGEPVAYLTGRRDFHARTFAVSPAVLIPRPETEHVLEVALDALDADRATRVVDVGTGSGCLAVSIAAERPLAAVAAVDVSAGALAVAARNARAHGVDDRVALVRGDLLTAIRDGTVDVVVSNPPYIARAAAATLPRDVREFEPHEALFSPGDPVDVYRTIVEHATRVLRPGGALIVEIGHDQREAVERLFRERFGQVDVVADLAGIARVVHGR